MPLEYSKNKKHIYKWRENNIDEWSAYNRLKSREFYRAHKGIDPYYSYDQITKEFRKLKW